MLTQIYEISTADEARAISAIGVNHIGAKVGTGEFARELSISSAREMVAAVVSPSKFSALFLSYDIALIADWVQDFAPGILHLGARPELLSPLDVTRLKELLPGMLIMRTIPVADERSIAIARSYTGIADFLMLDSVRSVDKQVGALGITHDWSISKRIVDSVHIPVFLAGGLGPDNVADAIRFVRPAGVDSKTKTDLGGSHLKDLQRVRQFHEAARAAV